MALVTGIVMRRLVIAAIGMMAASVGASAQQMVVVPSRTPMMVVATPQGRGQADLGGGFIEFLFGDRGPAPRVMAPATQPDTRPLYVNAPSDEPLYNPANPGAIDPIFMRQEVDYPSHEAPGTIVIDTPQRFLFLIEAGGKALRYGIGVGRPGFTWAGTHTVSAKREWPDWHPPEEMLRRQPWLPQFMAGGPNNPLGARAIYLGSTLYRIHGSNEPWTIGQMVSSGCIRMRNEDVIDLYGRVQVGVKVVVI